MALVASTTVQCLVSTVDRCQSDLSLLSCLLRPRLQDVRSLPVLVIHNNNNNENTGVGP